MVSNKVINCNIQSGWIFSRDGLAKNYMGPKSAIFSFSAWGWMKWGIDGCYPFILNGDFFLTVQPIEMKLKIYHYFNKTKLLVHFFSLLFCLYLRTPVLYWYTPLLIIILINKYQNHFSQRFVLFRSFSH